MGIVMMWQTIPLATLMEAIAVDLAWTKSFVLNVTVTLEIYVSIRIRAKITSIKVHLFISICSQNNFDPFSLTFCFWYQMCLLLMMTITSFLCFLQKAMGQIFCVTFYCLKVCFVPEWYSSFWLLLILNAEFALYSDCLMVRDAGNTAGVFDYGRVY